MSRDATQTNESVPESKALDGVRPTASSQRQCIATQTPIAAKLALYPHSAAEALFGVPTSSNDHSKRYTDDQGILVNHDGSWHSFKARSGGGGDIFSLVLYKFGNQGEKARQWAEVFLTDNPTPDDLPTRDQGFPKVHAGV